MMKPSELKQQAIEWIAAWNKRDIDKIMDHYADDVELSSSFVTKHWNIAEGMLSGKQKLLDHFNKSFESSPSGDLELLEFLVGVNSFILVYKSKSGAVSANLVELNEVGKVRRVKAYYAE